MQIRLGTARGMGYRGNEQGLLDADTNMTYAVKYLAGAYRAAGCNEARAVSYYQRGYYGAKRSKCATPQPQTQIAAAPAEKAAPAAVAAPEMARAPATDVLKPRVVRTQTIVQPRHELPAKPAPVKPQPETVARAEPQPAPKTQPVPVATPEPAAAAKPAPVVTAQPEPVPAVKPEPVVVAKPAPPPAPPRMNLATALSLPKPTPEPAQAPTPVTAKPDTAPKTTPPVANAKPVPPAVEPSPKPVMKLAVALSQPESKPVTTQTVAKPASAPAQVAALPTDTPAEVKPSTVGKIDLASVPLPIAKPDLQAIETGARKKKRERVAAAKPAAAEPAVELEQAAEKSSAAAEPNLVIAKLEPDAVPIPVAKPDVMPTEKP